MKFAFTLCLIILCNVVSTQNENIAYLRERSTVPDDNGDILCQTQYYDTVNSKQKIVYGTSTKKLLFYTVELDNQLQPELVLDNVDSISYRVYGIQHITGNDFLITYTSSSGRHYARIYSNGSLSENKQDYSYNPLNIKVFSVGAAHYYILSERTRTYVRVYKVSDIENSIDIVYCLSPGSSYDSNNFGCDGVEVFYDGTNYQLLLGLYTLEGVSHADGAKQEGIIIKNLSIAGDTVTENSEIEWELCLQSDCTATNSGSISQIEDMQLVTIGTRKYLFAVYSAFQFEVIQQYQFTEADRITSTDGTPYDDFDTSQLVTEAYINSSSMADGDTEWIQESDTQDYVELQKSVVNSSQATVNFSTVKVIQDIDLRIADGVLPTVYKDFQFTEDNSNTDISAKEVVYFNLDCKQYVSIVQANQVSIQELFDEDQPYFDIVQNPSIVDVQTQYLNSGHVCHAKTPFDFTANFDYYNKHGEGEGNSYSFEHIGTHNPTWLELNDDGSFTNTPSIDNFLDDSGGYFLKIKATNQDNARTYCEPFSFEIVNVLPTFQNSIQAQFEDNIGSFITDTLTNFNTAVGNYVDWEEQDINISLAGIRITQIDTSTPFRDETVLTEFPDWLNIQVNNDAGQKTFHFSGIAPSKDRKFEFRIECDINDGTEALVDTFILKITSFKNPFLGLELKSQQFSSNERAEKIVQYTIQTPQKPYYFTAVLVQNFGIQFNEIITEREQKQLSFYDIEFPILDLILYTPNNEQYFILYTGGGTTVYVLDVTNPNEIIEYATLDQFTDVYKLKIIDDGENSTNIVIFDNQQGLVFGDFTNETTLVNVFDTDYSAMGIFSDFLPMWVKEHLFYVGTQESNIVFMKGDSVQNLELFFKVSNGFIPKQMVTFSDEKRSYLAFTTEESGLQIMKFEDKILPLFEEDEVDACDPLYDILDPASNAAGACGAIKLILGPYFISSLGEEDVKNMVEMILYQDSEAKMLIISDGFKGVKIISVNFPVSPKVVTRYQSFDARSSVFFNYESEIYLGLADERAGSKMLQLIQGSSDKPFYSYAQDVAIVTQNDDASILINNARYVSRLKVGINQMSFVLNKYLDETETEISKITVLDTNDAQTPIIVTEYTSFNDKSIVSFQTFTFATKKYLIILFDDDTITVNLIATDNYALTPVLFKEAQDPVDPEDEEEVIVYDDLVIENILAVEAFAFDAENTLIAISDGTKLDIYKINEIEGSEDWDLQLTKRFTALSDIKKLKYQLTAGQKTLLMFEDNTMMVNIFLVEEINTYSQLSSIEIQEFMHEPLFYEQKKYKDEIKKEEIILHNQILVIADGKKGLKFYDMEDIENPVFLHQINTYDARCIKQLNFDASGLFLAYTDDIKGFRMLLLNEDIKENVPQQRVVYYTEEGPSNYIETVDQNGRIYGLLADGLSGLKSVELSSDIGLYPKLNQIIDNESKQFSLKFYPVYKNTLSSYLKYEIKLLDVVITEASRKILHNLPYWASANLTSRILDLAPPSKQSLTQTQFIYYKFSIEIDIETLIKDLPNGNTPRSEEEIIVLLNILQEFGYVTSTDHYFLTQNYDPTVSMDLALPSTGPWATEDVNKILLTLKQFLYEGFVEIDQSHFIALNSIPEVRNPEFNEMQNQYQSQVGNPVKVGQQFYFEFQSIFLDYDKDSMEYSVSQVREFRNMEHYERVMEEENPFGRRNLQGVMDGEIVVYENIDMLPWVEFNPSQSIFTGQPNSDCLDHIYEFTVEAFDGYSGGNTTFFMDMTDEAPQLAENPQLRLQAQFNNQMAGVNPHPLKDFRFSVKLDLFEDVRNDRLTYEILVKESITDDEDLLNEMIGLYNNGDYEALQTNEDYWQPTTFILSPFEPYWLKYDELSQILYAVPEVEQLGLYMVTIAAHDLNKQADDTFIMHVSNFGPELSTTSSLRLQSQYNLYLQSGLYPHPQKEFRWLLSMDLFTDQDKDDLTYTVILQEQSTDASMVQLLEQQYNEMQYEEIINNDDYWDEQLFPIEPLFPYWLKFDAESYEMYGIPQVEDYKFYRIKIEAADFELSVSDTFVLQVLNHAPQINRLVQEEIPKGRVDSGYEFVFNSNQIFDTDNDVLEYSVVELPDWLTFNPEMRKIEGTPHQKGDYNVVIKATDLVGANVNYSFQIKIGISWVQLIFIIIGILSPVASLAGLIKHQQQVYAILCKKQYTYNKYDLAPISNLYVKQIPLIRLELTEVQVLLTQMKKKNQDEIKKEKGKKAPELKIWAELTYLDTENNKLKEDLIKSDMIEAAKLANHKKVLKNFEDSTDFSSSHYFLICKANICREILLQKKSHLRVYNLLKKNLQDMPVMHYDDKGQNTKTLKSFNDWYKCLITKVDYDYINQEKNMFPRYELDKEYIESLVFETNELIKNMILKDPRIQQVKSEEYDLQNMLVFENIYAEAQGILIEFLKPFKGLSHGNSIVVRTQNIKCLQAYVRIDTYNDSNQRLAKLGFFKLDYVPLAGSVNQVLPEWLNFTINNGVLEFSGTPPVDYLGRHLMIQIISNKDFILQEFYIKFSDALLEDEEKGEKAVKWKKASYMLQNNNNTTDNSMSNLQTRRSTLFSQVFKSKQHIQVAEKARLLKEQKLKEKLEKKNKKKNSVKPEESVNSDRVLIETKNSLNNNKRDSQYMEQVGKIKELKISRNKVKTRMSYLKLSMNTLENKEKVQSDQLSKIEQEFENLDITQITSNLNSFEDAEREPEQEEIECLTLFASMALNDPYQLILSWPEIQESLAGIDQDFNIKEAASNLTKELYEKIDQDYCNRIWFGIQQPELGISEKTFHFLKWIQLVFKYKKALGQDNIVRTIEKIKKENNVLDSQLVILEKQLQKSRSDLTDPESQSALLDTEALDDFEAEEGEVEMYHNLEENSAKDLDIQLKSNSEQIYQFLALSMYPEQILYQDQEKTKGLSFSYEYLEKQAKIVQKETNDFLENNQECIGKALENFKINPNSNVLDLSHFQGNKYPEIFEKWNLLLYIAANVAKKEIKLNFISSNEIYEAQTITPFLVGSEAQGVIELKFIGKLDSGYFFLRLPGYFKNNQSLNSTDQQEISRSDLYKKFSE